MDPEPAGQIHVERLSDTAAGLATIMDLLHVERRAERACAEGGGAQEQADLPLPARAASAAVGSFGVIARPRSARPRLRRFVFTISVHDLDHESAECSEGTVHPTGANCSISGSAL